ALAQLVTQTWDDGNEFFPATSFQISNIHAGTGANNIIPGELTVEFNFRFSTESTEKSLKSMTEAIISKHSSDWAIEWKLSGPPFLTEGGELISTVENVIRERLDCEAELSTSGGTSDGRFIAPRGIDVVEFGPCNKTIHKVNEQVSIIELDQLSLAYEDILRELLSR
ncbi:MAG: M20/M25/M40 family metallo-hydrolase, partial [Gammaproteobacteria bacterium]|nr:M20/M25/M40 family metallo-hydrolase [Gammaproteobacteria bacterium]